MSTITTYDPVPFAGDAASLLSGIVLSACRVIRASDSMSRATGTSTARSRMSADVGPIRSSHVPHPWHHLAPARPKSSHVGQTGKWSIESRFCASALLCAVLICPSLSTIRATTA